METNGDRLMDLLEQIAKNLDRIANCEEFYVSREIDAEIADEEMAKVGHTLSASGKAN